MTFEEAKKILKKEGFKFEGPGKPGVASEFFTEYESPEICEAMQIVCSAGYKIMMLDGVFEVRKERLKKEYEKNTKAPGPGEEQPKEGNPALKESASQFNDALLDEQAKKIEELTKIKGDLNSWISELYFCIHHNNENYKYKLKRLGKEIAKLNSIIHDKNAVLSDVAEELRLSKIREKNLTEVCQKYMKENEELREKLKSINMNRHNERIYKKQLAEKDEVISDLGNELAATKKKLEEKTNLIEVVRKGSKEYCEYGIAAEKMIQKMAKEIVNDSPVPSKDYKQYRLWANGYSFNPQLPDFSEEEEKKLSSGRDNHPTEDNPEEIEIEEAIEIIRKAMKEGHTVSIDYDKAEESGDQSATIVQCDNGITLSKEEAEIIERCTKNGTELHDSEKDGFTYTNVFGEEMPIRCLRGMFHVFTDEEIENMKK